MVRIVICAGQKVDGIRLREALEAYAKSQGLANLRVLVTSSREELAALMTRLQPGFFGVALCNMSGNCQDMSLEEISAASSAMKSLSPETRFVFMSSDEAHARCAYYANGKFLTLPLAQSEFERTIRDVLDQVRRENRHMFGVKSGKVVFNLNLDDISFIEAGKKGPVIHLPEQTVLVTRTTLQALYDRLSQVSDSFMKVGGSFIVNLDNMLSANEGSAIFGDGETIILPTRLRKPVAEALQAHHLRSSGIGTS